MKYQSYNSNNGFVRHLFHSQYNTVEWLVNAIEWLSHNNNFKKFNMLLNIFFIKQTHYYLLSALLLEILFKNKCFRRVICSNAIRGPFLVPPNFFLQRSLCETELYCRFELFFMDVQSLS